MGDRSTGRRLSAEGTDLEIGEHPHFARHWRRVQSLLFAFFALLVVSAVAGVFGSGALAIRTAGAAAGEASIEYQRFARASAPQAITIHVHSSVSARSLEVHIDRALEQSLGIKTIVPEPVRSLTDAGGTRYEFAHAPGPDGDIRIEAQPRRPGLASGDMRIDAVRFPVSQLIWP